MHTRALFWWKINPLLYLCSCIIGAKTGLRICTLAVHMRVPFNIKHCTCYKKLWLRAPQIMTSHPIHQICTIQNTIVHITLVQTTVNSTSAVCIFFTFYFDRFWRLFSLFFKLVVWEVTVDVVWTTSCVDVSILLLIYLRRFPCDLWNAIPVWAYQCKDLCFPSPTKRTIGETSCRMPVHPKRTDVNNLLCKISFVNKLFLFFLFTKIYV